jgi:hypothetical protein
MASKPIAPESVATPERAATPKSPLVRVRARTAISEQIGADRLRFEAGEIFQLPESRATALGPLVEILK